MKTGGIIIVILGILWGIMLGINQYKADIQWNEAAGKYWTLADRASTLEAKRTNINLFVSAIDKLNLKGTHNTIFFEQELNGFDANFTALKTLQTRLAEMNGMDQNSMAYQQAIQQITAQEQGDAEEMIGNIYGCWMKDQHMLLFGCVVGWLWLAVIIVIIVGVCAAWTGWEQ